MTKEQQKEENNVILKSYEDTIKNLGDDVSIKTINRYCELVRRENSEPLKRYRFLKGRLDKKTDQIIKNKLNIEG
jgi:hypothetical protein